MKIYLAGPMSGYANFNFPKFHDAADQLRKVGHEVFNPAERDLDKYGEDFAERFSAGDIKEAEAGGFSLRDALSADLQWICEEAEAIALLPGWEHSSGAMAEWMAAKCLRLQIIYL